MKDLLETIEWAVKRIEDFQTQYNLDYLQQQKLNSIKRVLEQQLKQYEEVKINSEKERV